MAGFSQHWLAPLAQTGWPPRQETCALTRRAQSEAIASQPWASALRRVHRVRRRRREARAFRRGGGGANQRARNRARNTGRIGPRGLLAGDAVLLHPIAK